MNRDVERDEIKPLIINYIFHIILYILIFAMHLVIYYRVYWIFDFLDILYLFFAYCNIIYFLLPIIPIILLLMKKYKKKILNALKTITFTLLIITLIFGLMISIVLLVNTLHSNIFCKECPFNLSINHLNKLFQSYYGKKVSGDNIKKLCNSRRCVLDQENLDDRYPYIYLCNYNPSDEINENKVYKRKFQNDTEIKSYLQLKCFAMTSLKKNYDFMHSEINSYINLCFYYTDFYKCERFNEPEKKYNLKLDATCPEKNYLIIIYIVLVLIIIVDLIIPLIPWRIEFLSYKNILNILSITHRETNSVNSTARSSRISDNEGSFKKEKTPVLIFPLEDRINSENIVTSSNLISQINQNKEEDKNINDITNSFKEDEKIENKKRLINFKQIQNTERKKLYMKNIEDDVNNNEIYGNRFPRFINRNRKHYNESTTVISYQAKKKEKEKEKNENEEDEDKK